MKDILKKIIKIVLKILFVFPINNNKIYLMNFDGKSYGFDAKAFADHIIRNYPNKYKIYCETQNKKKFGNVDKCIKLIKRDTIFEIYQLMTAGIILCNFVPRSYIPYRKKQVIINTWHGNPVKKVGKYAYRYNKESYKIATCFTSHSQFYTDEVLRDSFEYDGNVLKCGAPRNDIFFNNEREEIKKSIMEKMHITNKRIILYAPTFRGDYEAEKSNIDARMIKQVLEEKFGGEWMVLYRLHPMVASQKKDKIMSFEKDVSDYSDMQDLLLISDILITDYSSSMWDFSLQRKPVFLYAPDINEYKENRGLYFSLDTLPYICCSSNEQLRTAIQEFDKDKYLVDLESYYTRVNNYEYGKSCETIIDYINVKQSEV